MFHNTLVVGASIRKPGKSSKTAKRPAIWIGVRPGELVGHQPCSITLWWLVRVRPAPPPSRAHRRFPLLWKCPSIAGLFELQCFVSDKVSWSDTPTFHNTLVVGSSPTSSTTNIAQARFNCHHIDAIAGGPYPGLFHSAAQ